MKGNEIGLTSDEAKILQSKYGKNEISGQKKQSFIRKVFGVISEPMFLLLIVAAVIYFILGEPVDGTVMLVFVVFIISIDVIQEWKTDRTLDALRDLSAPHIKVIRDNQEMTIASADLVPGDVMIISEGVRIPADGEIIKCSDLCVDESSLTGESEPVWKDLKENIEESADYWRKDYCYSGTLVTNGSAYILVDKIGTTTEYGKISLNVSEAPDRPTPLEKQVNRIVRICVLIAAISCLLVAIITYFNIPDYPFKERLIASILAGITLSMAMIPEEFPVILVVFLSMGAWRLAKKKSLVRNLKSVEALGSISVLCVDKTGTITMNKMTVSEIWSIDSNNKKLVHIMGMACETEAYDPMEKAMLAYCEKEGITNESLFNGELIDEYSFTNELKMMGHVWKRNDEILIAAKGAPENIVSLCNLSETDKHVIEEKINEISSRGMRVIAVAMQRAQDEAKIPEEISGCDLTLCGLIGLMDPPRDTIKHDIEICNGAGVRVVMITGDNGVTARSIAKQIGFQNCENIITGEELSKMSDEELTECVKDVNIFSRVLPEHKMRIVKAFKDNNEIVAMTGDGVNDAPALKYADIGIAMGKNGSEVSREAADLILLDDNFSTIVDTIEDGRRIYDNIRKAIGYVFAIHIPIAFAALLAPLLKVDSAYLLFFPLHVMLMELFVDPTCSIILERQPAESDIMDRKPRSPKEGILNSKTLIKSILQGLVIFGFSFGTYYMMLQHTSNGDLARTMGITILLLSNLFLIHVNSSEIDSVLYSYKRLIKDKFMWIVSIMTIIILLIIIYTPINSFLKLTALNLTQLLTVVLFSFLAVMWYEIIKYMERQDKKNM